MKVVIAFAKGDEGSDGAVSGSAFVIIGKVTERMGETIDAKGAVMAEDTTSNGSDEETTGPIAPKETTNAGWDNDARQDGERDVVFMLPDEKRILFEITDVGFDPLSVPLCEEPSHVGVPKAAFDVVGIAVGVCVAMMGAMIQTPIKD